MPAGILPSGLTGRLADVRVHARGPDDAIYDGNPEIREKVNTIKKPYCILSNNIRK